MSGKVDNLQYAALPYRRAGQTVEIMLITTRDTGRWIIPKGWPDPALDPGASAAQEAREESGLVGKISAQPIGSFCYSKRLADGSAVGCTVQVFALAVEDQLPTWPEQAERRRRWFAPAEAAEAVQEPELAALIRKLAGLIG
jgi:8-oxo-dGTP pyrophosphatase MutT (NUDIX family)